MELTTRLGQIGALKVVPWTFMKRFDAAGQPSFKEVAQRTGADAVIEECIVTDGATIAAGATHQRAVINARTSNH
jgi:hypothetical protein